MIISIVLPGHYQLSSVAILLEVFESVNSIYKQQNGEEYFKIQLIQSIEQKADSESEFHGHPIKSTRSKVSSNLVLIPAIKKENIEVSIKQNQSLIPWLQNQYKNGAELASFCTGAFLFAETGLLNGRLATTHVDVCAKFILAYPLVFVKPGRTLTMDWNCYTSGGATSSFHLLVFLIQKFCGNEMAVKISKAYSIELDRYHQSYFSTFRPIYSHNDALIRQIQEQLENHYATIKTIEEVTREYPASRRNLVRRFIKATGLPPIEYLQNVRIEKAKQLLENSDQSVSEIISQTGYADPKSFRKVFLKLVGIPPADYRNKFKMN
ncbi:MAG: helix-turn-helix domain-containing protein [Chitinophagaceae bacterium]|nr:helix-turn-helix domain-containing protein [Chitinophagaceae bacterium]